MLVVAGLSLKNLQPCVWDPASPFYLSSLQAVMVSYAEFHLMPARRRKAQDQGLHAFLRIPEHVAIYLDNGAFSFLRRAGETPRAEYESFIEGAKPDWWPIPQDYIPSPMMMLEEQQACFDRTMEVNYAYKHDGYTPVIHIGRLLDTYTAAIQDHEELAAKPRIALGGIVPNLLRAPKAMPYIDILDALKHVRTTFADKHIHVFGLGGTATLHLAALLNMDSADSSGWRNRAARGIVQLPGSGDRVVAELGKWRGRRPSPEEWERLGACICPACGRCGLEGLKAGGLAGFNNRAVHNLWVLLEENHWVEEQLRAGTYIDSYTTQLNNTTYLPLIRNLVEYSLD